MSGTDFVIATDTPGRLATFLESRNIIKQESDGSYSGVLPGLEWVEVPNRMETVPGSGVVGEPGYVWPVYDNRHIYLVKFDHESDSQKAQAFRNWIENNSSVVTLPSEWTVAGEPAGQAYKINGQNVWIIKDNPERFGAWQ
jgi:hypothetical protein